MTTTQQHFAAAIAAVLTLALVRLMAVPATAFGFFGTHIPKAGVVWPLFAVTMAWLVYAQRYRPDSPA
jgi:hypothetical protein